MDVEAFRIPGTSGLPEQVPPAGRRTHDGLFLRGPVDLAWLKRAKMLPKSALATGLALWFKRGVMKSDCPIKVTAAVRRTMCLTPDDARRGIRALATNGLVRVVKGGRGRHPVVEIILHSDASPTAESTARVPHEPDIKQAID